MSFVEKLQKKSGGKGIFYIWGSDTTGRKAWYYVKVHLGKENQFEQALKKRCTLTDFGDIINSGYGEKSPEEIRKEMFEKYGFKHDDD